MFPIILIETSKKNYNQYDIIKDINNNYNLYFKRINQQLDIIVYNNFKFKEKFNFKNVSIWFSNNLSERNIQKGNLINNLLILEFLKIKIKKRIKIKTVKTDSRALLKSIKILNLECNLLYSEFNLDTVKKNFFLLSSFIFFLKVIIKSILINSNKSLKYFLSKSNIIFLTPFEAENNNYLASISNFNNKIEKFNNSKIIHIQYLSNIDHKYKKIVPKNFPLKFNKEKIFVIFELINFFEVLFCFFIYLKFYFISNKYLNEISLYFENTKKKHLYFAIHQEIKDSFKGSILFQNILYIYIFNKIKNYSLSNSKIFYNFENQYWEKILLQVFKDKNYCKFGIIDAPPKLWDSNLYMKNNRLFDVLYPNYILYSSPVYAKLIKPTNSFIKKKLILIESFKYKKNKSNRKISNNKILIFGDGNKLSHNLLIQIVLKLKYKLNNKFVFFMRAHSSNLRYSYDFKKSSNSLEKDINSSCFFIIPNTSNSYLDILLNNKIPLVFESKETINKSIFKFINLNYLTFQNEDDLYYMLNNINKINLKKAKNEIIKNLIHTNNSFVLFEKFVKLHL